MGESLEYGLIFPIGVKGWTISIYSLFYYKMFHINPNCIETEKNMKFNNGKMKMEDIRQTIKRAGALKPYKTRQNAYIPIN